MKVFPEYFDTQQFNRANYQMIHCMKWPYINFYKTLNFAFQEYNANIKLQCVHWHRIMQTCVNIFGFTDYKRNIRCQEANWYFEQCLGLNTYFAYMKKYNPQEFFTSEYYKISPHYDQVFLGN